MLFGCQDSFQSFYQASAARRVRWPSFLAWVRGTCAALIAGLVHAGPPFVTDDPEPADYHTWEVNYALTGTHSAGETSASLPSIDANYGALPGLQLHIQPQMAYSHQGGRSTFGLGDMEIGAKYRLTPESDDPSDWMVSVYPLYEIPTGNAHRHLGAGVNSALLPIWFQTTRGNWQTFGGGGLWINPGAGNKNAWYVGWAALYQMREGVQIGGEVFDKTADTVGGKNTAGFNLGGVVGLSKDYNLLFSAGRGLNHIAQSNEASAYLGLQVIY